MTTREQAIIEAAKTHFERKLGEANALFTRPGVGGPFQIEHRHDDGFTIQVGQPKRGEPNHATLMDMVDRVAQGAVEGARKELGHNLLTHDARIVAHHFDLVYVQFKPRFGMLSKQPLHERPEVQYRR